jgi:uncharacterized membrane protein
MNCMRRTTASLLSLIAAYVTITLYVNIVRYEHFLNYEWDLGVIMQSLWSTTHGFLMFETADFSTAGLKSYLELNTSLIALPVAFLFRFFPSASFLFLLQSIVVGASAIPLFLISSNMGNSERSSLILCALYLFSFPLLSAIFFDFHWEAFIPVEYLFLFYFVQNSRRIPSFLIILLGTFTLQVFPFLSAAIGLFKFTERKKAASLLGIQLILFSAFSFVVDFSIQHFLIFPLVGSVYPDASHVIHFIAIGKLALPLSSMYWLLLLLSLGFLPLLRPSYLILSIPWFIESTFLYSFFSVHLGNQYAFIAFPPLAVSAAASLPLFRGREPILGTFTLPSIIISFALITGLTGISRYLFSTSPDILYPSIYILSYTMVATILSYFLIFRRKEIAYLLAKNRGIPLLLISLLILNLALGPLNTLNYNATTYAGYRVTFQQSPAFSYFIRMISVIPRNATIFASNNLFPYVAKDLNAYGILYTFSRSNFPYLPFTASNPPEFVLLDTSYFLIPPFLSSQLFNTSVYGLRSYILEQQFPGTIYLFQLHYRGATQSYMLYRQPVQLYLNYRNFDLGPSGFVAHLKNSRYGYVIESRYAHRNEGVVYNTIWYGPYITLKPGAYILQMNLSVSGNGSVLYVDGSSIYSPLYYSLNLTSTHGWRTITVYFTVKEPYPISEFRGYLVYSNGTPAGRVILNYMVLKYLG